MWYNPVQNRWDIRKKTDIPPFPPIDNVEKWWDPIVMNWNVYHICLSPTLWSRGDGGWNFGETYCEFRNFLKKPGMSLLLLHRIVAQNWYVSGNFSPAVLMFLRSWTTLHYKSWMDISWRLYTICSIQPSLWSQRVTSSNIPKLAENA